jgi:medium-chain acyl-[acyl-carrier-protein] hydrolase
MFRKWDTKLPGNVEVCAIQLPGREERLLDPPFRQIGPLVNVLSEVVPISPEKPFVFFGHSMGALIAFELSRRLRRLGARQPDHLFVSGFRAPHLPDRQAPTYDLPDAEFIEELRRLSGTPEEVLQSSDLMAFLMPTLRADFALTERYSYVQEMPLECSISAFCGSGDPEVNYDEITAWGQHTNGSFHLQMIPGNHFFLLGQEQAQLLGLMSEELNRIIGIWQGTYGD